MCPVTCCSLPGRPYALAVTAKISRTLIESLVLRVAGRWTSARAKRIGETNALISKIDGLENKSAELA